MATASNLSKDRNWRSLRYKLTSVLQLVERCGPDESSRVVAFVGTSAGAAVSPLVRSFAAMATDTIGRKVALIDLNGDAGEHYDYFGVSKGSGLDWSASMETSLVQTKSPSLSLGHFNAETAIPEGMSPEEPPADAIQSLRKQFDLVVLDASHPPGNTAGLGRIAFSDGVVMVVEAERTRWQVAENVLKQVEMNGGRVLGVVVNKRKFHIPGFIYQRL